MKHDEILELLKDQPKDQKVMLEFKMAGLNVTTGFKDESLASVGNYGRFMLESHIASAFFHKGVTVDDQSEMGEYPVFWRASATPQVWQEVLTLPQPGVMQVTQEAVKSLMAKIDPDKVVPEPHNPFHESDHVHIAFAKPALALA